ncbi:MAG: ribbon-helix-helix domain-containing protein [Terrimicrobiaceae bacterium]|nr:ribbon-helix-helix domain-containing protein [Terrimicrobiaceae bacterium]
MSETLSIRLPSEDKRALFEIAARHGGSINEFVRQAIRGKLKEVAPRDPSPLAGFFRSVPVDVPAPTNDAVRRAMKKMSRMTYLVDTGPLVSAFARREPKYKSWAEELLGRLPLPLVTCEAVITEASHLLGSSVRLMEAIRDP